MTIHIYSYTMFGLAQLWYVMELHQSKFRVINNHVKIWTRISKKNTY